MTILLTGKQALLDMHLKAIVQSNTRTRPSLSKKDLKDIREITSELDTLYGFPGSYQSSQRAQAKEFSLPNIQINLEDCKDPIRSSTLLERTGQIVAPYEISTALYFHLGRAFDEIGEKPSKDIKEAISYATAIREIDSRSGVQSTMCWNMLKHRPVAYQGAFGKIKFSHMRSIG